MGRPTKQPTNYFGQKLREFRHSQKLTQQKLALMWGVDRGDLSRYELYTIPTSGIISKLNRAFKHLNLNAHLWVSKDLLPSSTKTESQLAA